MTTKEANNLRHELIFMLQNIGGEELKKISKDEKHILLKAYDIIYNIAKPYL